MDEESKKSNVMLLNEGGGVCLMWFQLGLKEFSIVLGFFSGCLVTQWCRMGIDALTKNRNLKNDV